MQIPLFPLLHEQQLHLPAEGGLDNQDMSSCLGQTSVAAFLCSLALAAEILVSPPPPVLPAALPGVINATADGLGRQCL